MRSTRSSSMTTCNTAAPISPIPKNSLEQAQADKKAHIAAKLDLKPGQRVLDIGCGWGGMALYLHKVAGVDVLGITLSRRAAQGRPRARQDAGVSDHVKFELIDYRQLEGASTGSSRSACSSMSARAHYDEFFAKCRELLTDDGVMLLHTIGKLGGAGTPDPFTDKWIFPGYHLPALSQMCGASEKVKLIVSDIEMLRLHYAFTLRHWLDRATKARAKIEALYDARFFRMWEFYLAGGIVMFESGSACNYQVQYVRDRNAVPITRDYMLETERKYRALEKRPAPAAKKPRSAGVKKMAETKPKPSSRGARSALSGDLPPLVRRDLAIMVEVGSIEMRERSGLRFRSETRLSWLASAICNRCAPKPLMPMRPPMHASCISIPGTPGATATGASPSRMTTRSSRICGLVAMNSWRLIEPSWLVSSWSNIAVRLGIGMPSPSARRCPRPCAVHRHHLSGVNAATSPLSMIRRDWRRDARTFRDIASLTSSRINARSRTTIIRVPTFGARIGRPRAEPCPWQLPGGGGAGCAARWCNGDDECGSCTADQQLVHGPAPSSKLRRWLNQPILLGIELNLVRRVCASRRAALLTGATEGLNGARATNLRQCARKDRRPDRRPRFPASPARSLALRRAAGRGCKGHRPARASADTTDGIADPDRAVETDRRKRSRDSARAVVNRAAPEAGARCRSEKPDLVVWSDMAVQISADLVPRLLGQPDGSLDRARQQRDPKRCGKTQPFCPAIGPRERERNREVSRNEGRKQRPNDEDRHAGRRNLDRQQGRQEPQQQQRTFRVPSGGRDCRLHRPFDE